MDRVVSAALCQSGHCKRLGSDNHRFVQRCAIQDGLVVAKGQTKLWLPPHFHVGEFGDIVCA